MSPVRSHPADRLRRLLRVPVVADHHVRTLDAHLAHFAGGQGAVVVVPDRHRHTRDGLAYRAELADAGEPVGGDHGRCLRQAVPLQQLAAELALEGLHDLDRSGAAPVPQSRMEEVSYCDASG